MNALPYYADFCWIDEKSVDLCYLVTFVRKITIIWIHIVDS